MKSVSLRETFDSLRNRELSSAYFLNGDDYYLQSLFVDELMKALSSDGSAVEKHFVSAESADYTSIVTDLSSDSLFGDCKLYILHNPTRISGKAKDDLFRYCSSPSSNNCLVVMLDKVDRRLAFYKNLSRLLPPINTSPPFPNKMTGWVQFLLKRNGVSATTEASELLLELCGDSVYHIANEIEKIKIGIPENYQIDVSHIKEFCGWKREFFPWHLSDAVARRDLKGSVQIGRSLVSQGIDVSSLVSNLATLFQELYLMRLPDGDNGPSPKTGWLNQILSRKLPNYLNNFSQNELEEIIKSLYKADQNIKTGKSSGERLLISLLHRITVGHA
ncbi:MAG: DNA polymerase III subunit delta [Candidatus Marinimicrobia bacterium]|nr:DNA polymerase III subunit delta [Candidatus Neomarinimicrobiota bacterium]|tara:strand:+ start:9039 stop:10034 length:996 start_codon:yes stop_codon:yes gene_type:complete